MRLMAIVGTVLCAMGAALWSGEATPPTLRLPASVRPLRGRLELTIVPSRESFTGTATYDLAISEPTATLWIHATGLKLQRVELAAGGASQTATVIPGNEDVVGLRFAAPVLSGPARLTLAWEGALDSARSQGLYRVKEGDDWYAYTFFEPIDARRAFPCFDEPGFKIPWTLVLHVPQDQVGLANAPAMEETAEPGGMKRITFAESRPLPSYLVALVVGPFDVIPAGTAGHHGTPLRFVVPKGRGAEIRYAAESTPRLVGLLEDFFGMPYPFGKLDVAVVPRYWGTMEHPGLVALGQPLTLIKPGEETPARKEFYSTIAVHELGHYWFGDVVTMAWWDDTWLNEGMTTWIDAKMMEAFEPSWRVPANRLQLMANAMAADALPSAKRVRQPVASKDGIENSFDNNLTYFKGNALMTMVERWVGPDRFRGIVRSYVQRHQWGNATSEDWLQAVQDGAGAQARSVFEAFIGQPGVPVLTGRCVQTPGGWSLEITQRRFLSAGTEPGTPAVWTIPVGIRTDRTSEPFYAVLTEKSATFPIPGGQQPEWILLNAGGSGYYRVAYEADQLAALLRAPASALTVQERFRLLDDARAMGETGALDLESTLRLAGTAAQDPDRLIVAQSLALAARIPAGLLGPADRLRLARYLRATWGARARTLGWTPRSGEDVETRRLRALLVPLVAFRGQDPALTRDAKTLAARWLKSRKGVDPDLVVPILATAARASGRSYFERMVAQARATQDRQERARLMAGLGAFRAPALVNAALDLMLRKDFDIRESVLILDGALSDPETRPMAWAWLQRHFDEMAPLFRSDDFCGLVGRLGEALWDTVSRESFEGFLRPRVQPFDGGPLALTRALESMEVHQTRGRRDLEASTRFLRGKGRS
ncbi:M1 family metallopeptidase [Geothrix alkalitolerans]|uniref:M1 family metallopeptidase n=1 Tax=Geothrix alkalitolerans TaxID=2922724 RepID=UPI001FAE988B|nr:M1 family metallopeptidase [Geothrix alkalitolerans]